jgi:hypothetical protein
LLWRTATWAAVDEHRLTVLHRPVDPLGRRPVAGRPTRFVARSG